MATYEDTTTHPFGIEALDFEGIHDRIRTLGYPSFRSKQLIQWVYQKQVESYYQMTNLPAKMREELARVLPLDIPQVSDRQVSKDGSRKYVLTLADGCQVETVGIPSHDSGADGESRRLTVCFSTQVGCPMQCAFCATGHEGLTRNLLPGEMLQQILTVQRDFNARVSNVVAMGQGEPFLNYDNFIKALKMINAKEGLGIGARHITVSSCGILDGIRRFGLEEEQYTLAISLHSARQDIRDAIMPRCKNMPLTLLKDTLREYYRNAKRRVSFEYLMIDGVNDADEDLIALIRFCKGLHVHINLIPLNDIDDSPWKPSASRTLAHWIDSLNAAGIETTLRNSRGSDIAGACGQLKNKQRSRI